MNVDDHFETLHTKVVQARKCPGPPSARPWRSCHIHLLLRAILPELLPMVTRSWSHLFDCCHEATGEPHNASSLIANWMVSSSFTQLSSLHRPKGLCDSESQPCHAGKTFKVVMEGLSTEYPQAALLACPRPQICHSRYNVCCNIHTTWTVSWQTPTRYCIAERWSITLLAEPRRWSILSKQMLIPRCFTFSIVRRRMHSVLLWKNINARDFVIPTTGVLWRVLWTVVNSNLKSPPRKGSDV